MMKIKKIKVKKLKFDSQNWRKDLNTFHEGKSMSWKKLKKTGW